MSVNWAFESTSTCDVRRDQICLEWIHKTQSRIGKRASLMTSSQDAGPATGWECRLR